MALPGLGLIADYGSSSENEELDEELLIETPIKTKTVNYFKSISDDETDAPPKKKKKAASLANPLRNDGSVKSLFEPSSSVFYNPFKKDEEAKKSVLEKHVKLTTNPKDAIEINGKKICWNYRKGRCKFGHKCKYAHDSDLIESKQNTKCDNLGNSDKQCSSLDSINKETKGHKKKKSSFSKSLKTNKHTQKNVKKSKFGQYERT